MTDVTPGVRLDSLDMFEAAAELPEQLATAAAAAAAIENLPSGDGLSAIAVLGMGGSGIGGDMLAAIAGPRSAVPIVVSKGYELPAFVGPDTLVFAISFSGNTEETIAAATAAAAAGGRMVVVAAGGELVRLAGEWGAPIAPIADGIPMPRAGIGAVTVPPLVILERLGVLEGVSVEIADAVDHLSRRRDELGAAGSVAAELARCVGRTMPVVYGGGALGEVAAARWKGQFNENAKVASFANRIPELTHNEICGWGQHGDVTRQVFSLVLLRHAFEHSQTRRRFDMVAEIMDEVVAGVHQVEAVGDSPLVQLFDLVMLGDFVSLELAEQSGVDPGPVPILDQIKAELKG